VDTCGSAIDTALAIYTGTCGSLTEIACNDDATGCPCNGPASSIDLPALAAGTYVIRVSDKNIGTGGAFTVLASLTAVANDNCANAPTITVGTAVNGTTACTTNDGVSSCDPTGRDVWYKVVATAGQNLHIQTCGSTIDTVVAVYSGTCGSLTE